MRPEGKKLLWDVAESCADVQRITKSISFEEYLGQRDTARLVERYLEIIGEALRQFEHAEPTLAVHVTALRRWVDLRNVIAHGYDFLDDQIIWDVCRNSVPSLREEILRLLDQ
jgi:uncharacterized protein with HEPN domain